MGTTTMANTGLKEADKNFQLSEADFGHLLIRLQQGEEHLFESVFLVQFEPAMNYLKKRFNTEHELAYDTVMTTMTDFFYRLKSGKVKYGNLRYLFNQMLVQEYYRRYKKEWKYEEFDGIDLIDVKDQKEEVMNLFDQAFTRLGAACQELLRAYYYRGVSYPSLSEQLGKSQAAIRKQKQRCQQHFKSFFRTLLEQNPL
ncbi:MAG: sigma-70 family RNA polymerase sigma factor [Bacteroidota bacterium]